MAIYGGVREGWARASGPRYNETLFRGSATFAGASVDVTLPLPARLVTKVTSVIEATASAPSGLFFTVDSIVGNKFTIYAWSGGASGVPAAASAITVGTSVYSYTSGTSGTAAKSGETLFLEFGGSATSTWTVTRGSVTTGTATIAGAAAGGNAVVVLMPGDVFKLTYASTVPTMYSFPFGGVGGTPVAVSATAVVNWEAWANCAGVTGSY